MSDAQQPDTPEEHDAGIKTPKQLIAVITASIVIPVIVIMLLTNYVAADHKTAPGSAAMDAEAVARRIQPIGTVSIKDASAVAAVRTGEQVYTGQCSACHAIGAAGSPKFGDTDAWAPRIAKGFDALWASALNGKGNMTKQGGGEYSDYEVARAVVFMANKGGAHFDEPKAPAAAASAASAPASAP